MQVLRTALSENAVRVIDLFRDWDVNGDGAVSFKEFVMGVTLLGFPGDRAAAMLFREWDSDGSGSLQVIACSFMVALLQSLKYLPVKVSCLLGDDALVRLAHREHLCVVREKVLRRRPIRVEAGRLCPIARVHEVVGVVVTHLAEARKWFRGAFEDNGQPVAKRVRVVFDNRLLLIRVLIRGLGSARHHLARRGRSGRRGKVRVAQDLTVALERAFRAPSAALVTNAGRCGRAAHP